MATTETSSHDVGHDPHHEHPPFLAHHFETPEQQFDSGKLGMWLFLVTEVLFFSGLFCAYAMFRAARPDVFQFSSQFLNTELGAINTGVLLLSSLTMAWAVRAAQKEQHGTLVGMLAATLSCAAIFLGVKAVEYSHKWDLGLLPAGSYKYDAHELHHGGISDWLLYLSVVPAVFVVGIAIWLIAAKLRAKSFQVRVAVPLLIAAACYFVGVGLGIVLETGGEEPEPVAHSAHDELGEAGVPLLPEEELEEDELEQDAPPPVELDAAEVAAAEAAAAAEVAAAQEEAGLRAERQARQRQLELAFAPVVSGAVVEEPGPEAEGAVAEEVNTQQLAGVFFSIYYCMTGVHAIHILAGMGVLTWLLVRAVRQDFNRQYFGPVDYVGLYWHLVDLIWIYLFPLLYLIR